MKRRFEERAIFDDPPVNSRVNSRVIHVDPTLEYQFFDGACAQWIRDIPPDPHENDLFRDMGPFEAHRRRCSPSLCPPGYRRRAYPKVARMKNATELWLFLYSG
jgi:hypothetical protein